MLWKSSGDAPSVTPRGFGVTAVADPEEDLIGLKVRVHQRLLELLNLAVLDKTPREALRAEIRSAVTGLLAEEKRLLSPSQTRIPRCWRSWAI